MKKFLKVSISILTITILSAAVYAETASTEDISSQIGSILVSALYFIGVLTLIYIILTLVSKWGKKHSDKQGENTENNTEDTNEIIISENEKNEK